ncbi:hypothetical protein AMTR_s00002p00243830 [Amborella trichopoda]|uniref:Uncharacterized protein n=1 Tax=Amborella trichopoda TaxID=13333 RepID=W1NZZ6_AMBTC|nr:hypothetical protein AMTR_s00002p00243830 [Amborella trichopoda]
MTSALAGPDADDTPNSHASPGWGPPSPRESDILKRVKQGHGTNYISTRVGLIIASSHPRAAVLRGTHVPEPNLSA